MFSAVLTWSCLVIINKSKGYQCGFFHKFRIGETYRNFSKIINLETNKCKKNLYKFLLGLNCLLFLLFPIHLITLAIINSKPI